jgi:quercetin dioxygenase-like cupin family protein
VDDFGAFDSGSFTDETTNRCGLEPAPLVMPVEKLVHRGVCDGAEAPGFSATRGHPVFPVRLPSLSISYSVGELAPGAATSNHRHAYESLIYVLEGEGWSVIQGARVDWREGDAFFVPPWNWHQHFSDGRRRVRYLTATNLPLLSRLGQTALREEQAE